MQTTSFLTKKLVIPFCHLGASQWVYGFPPDALLLDLPARPGDNTDEEVPLPEDDEEEEDAAADVLRGALDATAGRRVKYSGVGFIQKTGKENNKGEKGLVMKHKFLKIFSQEFNKKFNLNKLILSSAQVEIRKDSRCSPFRCPPAIVRTIFLVSASNG